MSKGPPANTNTKFLFVWAEGRGRVCIAMDRKWPVRGFCSFSQCLSCEGSQKVPLKANPEFPFANIREIPGIFLST